VLTSRLPTFLLCGAQKAGTTALYAALQEHPDVCMSRPKETEFFNWRYYRGLDWYRTHFQHYDGETAVGEASTRIMPTAEAIPRIKNVVPDCRLIFVLRNPVDRAFSAFWFYSSTGILCSTDTFSAFIRNEGHPLRQEIIDYGRYDVHLRRFYTAFDDENILVLLYDEVKLDMVQQLRELFQFIGVSEPASDYVPEQKNVTRYPSSGLYALARQAWTPIKRIVDFRIPSASDLIRKWGKASKDLMLRDEKPSMSSQDREYLRSLYRPHVQRLADDFGITLSNWN